jgi:hypothetical protein
MNINQCTNEAPARLYLFAALFTIAKLWNQSRCPSTDGWIKKIQFIYTMEYYSAIKENEFRSFAIKWMELESSC